MVTTAAISMEAFVNPVSEELARRGHSLHLVAGDGPARASFEHTTTVIPMTREISVGADARALFGLVHCSSGYGQR